MQSRSHILGTFFCNFFLALCKYACQFSRKYLRGDGPRLGYEFKLKIYCDCAITCLENMDNSNPLGT